MKKIVSLSEKRPDRLISKYSLVFIYSDMNRFERGVLLGLLQGYFTKEQLKQGVNIHTEKLEKIIGSQQINKYRFCMCCNRLIIPRQVKNFRTACSSHGSVGLITECPQCAALIDSYHGHLFNAKLKEKDFIILEYIRKGLFKPVDQILAFWATVQKLDRNREKFNISKKDSAQDL